MATIVIQPNTDSETRILLRKLYSPHGELSRAEYFKCAFFLFIPCKIVLFAFKVVLTVLTLLFKIYPTEESTLIYWFIAECIFDFGTFGYPVFIIAVKRLRFVGYTSKRVAFLVAFIIIGVAIASLLDLDLTILLAVYFGTPSILLFKINGK